MEIDLENKNGANERGTNMKRQKTNYPGVYFRESKRIGGTGTEKVFYVTFTRDGKMVEAKAGRQYQDDMTPARAARIRGQLIEGRIETRKEKRDREQAEAAEVASKWTLDRIAAAYFEKRDEGASKLTDTNRYALHLHPHFGHKEPAGIIKLDLDRLRIQLSKKLAPQTVKHVLNLYSIIVRYGAENGFCAHISFRITKPIVNNETTEHLEPDQLKRYLDEVDREPDEITRNALLLVLNTGIRKGELCKLEWRDVDLDRRFLELRDPKGGPSQKIPLNDSAVEILAFHPRRDDSPYVFYGRGGRRRRCFELAKRIRDRAGLPKSFRPLHGLRHAYASMMASSGKVDLYTLQRLLTHKSPTMTQRYAHLADEAMKRASGVAADIIGEAVNAK